MCRLSLQLSAAGSCSRCTLLAPPWALYFLLVSLVISPENTIALYADDCKTSSIIVNPEDHVSFEHDHLCSWSQLNSIDFYIKKCKVMRISRKKQPLDTNLLMHDSSLNIVSEFKDLGLLVSYNLSWNSHINHSFQCYQNVGFNLMYMQGSIFYVPACIKDCSLERSQLEYSLAV